MWPTFLFSDSFVEASGEALPEVVVTLFAYLTILGDFEVYLVLLLTYYFGVNRERGIALLVVALSIATIAPGIKEIFALERPPGELHDPRTGGGGYGLPSGHTLSAFVIYGALLSAIDSLSPWQKGGFFAAVVGAVSASRVVLGVHYPADVLAAWLVGAVILGLYIGVARLEVPQTVAFAIGMAGPLLVYAWGNTDLYIGIGGLVGAAIAWWAVGSHYRFDVRQPVGIALVVVGMALVYGVTVALESFGIHLLAGAVLIGLIAGAYPDLVRLAGERVGGHQQVGLEAGPRA